MKTRPEIESLKANWLRDPCWDVEATDGFEEHRDELREFRLASEARWKAADEAREAEIDAEAERPPVAPPPAASQTDRESDGVHGLLRLVRRLEDVQRRHDAALFHLTENRAHAAWCALTGREGE